MKQWLDNWRRVGPALEEERWTRLTAMSERDTQTVVASLAELWQPDWATDNGEELLLHQSVFARARRGR